MTKLNEIKARDAAEDMERSVNSPFSGSPSAQKDRRWLLARIKSLAVALRESPPIPCRSMDGLCWCPWIRRLPDEGHTEQCERARSALAALEEVVTLDE